MPMLIAAAVRRLRKERKWSQKKLADAINSDRTTINKLEQGKGGHKYQTLKAIADAFGVSISEITGETPESSGLSHDALLVARAFDRMDVEDRAAVKRLVLRFAQGPPSSRS